MKELEKLIEDAAEDLKYVDPIDVTQWSYNEGVSDITLKILELIKNKNDK